jgi:type VI secretion system secreted protein VgrG
VGEEVAVLYLDGNIDHPVILGALYNAIHMPPWRLPEQQALSGLRSRELHAAQGSTRGNHLILDDTTGKIQAQLKSDHQCSQLSLGHITRIEDASGRKDARGEGWEIATNAWGVARAGKGMLITTEARNNAARHCKDMGDTIERLSAAKDIHEDLTETARINSAQDSPSQQGGVVNTIKNQNDGIKGNGSIFPELAQPHLVVSSSAGIAVTTAQSTHIASDANTALTTGRSLSIASGDSLFASIRQTFRLFVHKAGMKLVAAAGDIDMETLSESINLLAKLNITHTANKITITAKEEIVINGGGSYVRFNAGGIEHGTNGNSTVHAAKHSFVDAKSMDVNLLIPRQGGHDPKGTFIFSA